KILVTGGAGFIGANLLEELLPHHQLVVVDNLSTGKASNILNEVRFYQTDILSEGFAEIVAMEKPEFIIHLAAQINVAESFVRPLADLETNILGTLKVLEAAKRNGIQKVIYPSSAAVYGCPQFLPISEDHPIAPMSFYGISKHTPEHYLQVYFQTYALRYTILRFANVYGPRQDSGGEGGVVSIFTDNLLKNKPLLIYGDGEQTRDFVFVKDVAGAICKSLTAGDNQIYNIGSGQKISINDLFQQIKKLTASKVRPQFLPARSGDIRDSLFNISKAQLGLGWEPKTSIDTGLRLTMEWFLTH
ncbi:MAG TPA: UDP-glucose 4-epimerase, partial [Firmicutes bacterium]|nr:UDP-glucose 4-epimerase [Bacillota bacterium]